MRNILTMIRLHIFLNFQEPSMYVQAFVVPIVIMAVLSMALRGGQTTIPIDILDLDNSPLSQQFISILQNVTEDQSVVLCFYDEEADNPERCNLADESTYDEVGEERLKEGRVSATLILPAGFGASAEVGAPIQVEYRSDEGLNTGTVANNSIQTALAQFNSSLAIASAGVTAAENHLGGYPDEAGRVQDFGQLRQAALTKLETPPIRLKTSSSGEALTPGFGSQQSVPGIGSMFVLFSLLLLAPFMIEERRNWTLQRLLTLPVPRYQIVIGKITGALMAGVLQFAVFVVFGLMMGVNWGNDPLALAAIIFAYCLAGASLGFLLSTLVKTADQAASISTLMGLVLAPLGGAWWPLDIVPDLMQKVGHISPIAWAMDGFQDLIYYDGTLVDVLPEVGALLLFAVVFIALAIPRFRYE